MTKGRTIYKGRGEWRKKIEGFEGKQGRNKEKGKRLIK